MNHVRLSVPKFKSIFQRAPRGYMIKTMMGFSTECTYWSFQTHFGAPSWRQNHSPCRTILLGVTGEYDCGCTLRKHSNLRPPCPPLFPSRFWCNLDVEPDLTLSPEGSQLLDSFWPAFGQLLVSFWPAFGQLFICFFGHFWSRPSIRKSNYPFSQRHCRNGSESLRYSAVNRFL